MESTKVSVIVTIHNAEKFIRECIESVRNQTFTDIEILCMDGGSTDSTPEILKNYAQIDNRIRIINDSNTSYGHKVNRGIAEARGKYVSVLESDDMYEPFMLETLYTAMEKFNVDFVNGGYTEFYEIDGRRIKHTVRMYEDGHYNCIINYRKHPEGFENISRYWTGLFKKDYLVREGIRMNESPGASYQDMSFRFLTSMLSSATYHLDIPVYLYRIDNPASSMYDSKKTVIIADEHKFLEKELTKREITEPYVWHMAYQWKYTDFFGNMLHLHGAYRQELFERYLEELEKDRVLLEKYKGMGYGRTASAMIYETPETVARLIEDNSGAERKRQKFWERVMQLDKQSKIVIFGCGKKGRMLLEETEFLASQICCATDNAKELWDTEWNGKVVLPPADAVRKYPGALYIVANKLHAQDIAGQLQDMGIRQDMICFY